MIYIGIDPGVKTGYCFYNPHANDLVLETMPIFTALVEAKGDYDIYKHCDVGISLVMEDARLRKWFLGGKEKAQGVGSIKRDCQVWEEFCEYYNIPLIKVPPKDNKTKLSPEAFAKITGYTKRTSNHARDAAMLVWGRK
jgi:hypothetical protein